MTIPASESAERQRRHYDRVAERYAANLGYPHTREYMRYLDSEFVGLLPAGRVGVVVELCCGTGEAYALVADRADYALGVDVSVQMLMRAQHRHPRLRVLQADATRLPLQDGIADMVLIHGGIHHVPDRLGLFREVSRILKRNGRFYFHEPVDDFWLWRLIRKLVYRVSPALDHTTEAPLRKASTFGNLTAAGLRPVAWKTRGLIGFCLFMNSDILIVNRAFRFVPGIRLITRAACRLDDWLSRFRGLESAGLIALGAAEKM
jgi:ubiquinone/menaquinone biosynthesis C-methylase UbiE